MEKKRKERQSMLINAFLEAGSESRIAIAYRAVSRADILISYQNAGMAFTQKGNVFFDVIRLDSIVLFEAESIVGVIERLGPKALPAISQDPKIPEAGTVVDVQLRELGNDLLDLAIRRLAEHNAA